MGAYAATLSGFGLWFRNSGHELPESIATRDLVLITIASHKLSRLITRDRVTSAIRAPFTRFQEDAGTGEVNEAARGRGMRRAIGELLVCPYCLGLWIATTFVSGLLVAPRATRVASSTFVVLAGEDALQIAYAKAQQTL